jgi:hypothetical protein
MYRVFLVPANEFAPKELWLDAHAVVETEGGEFWDFVDREERLIRRLAKSGVNSFEVTPDRRKPRPAQESLLSDIPASFGASFSHSI